MPNSCQHQQQQQQQQHKKHGIISILFNFVALFWCCYDSHYLTSAYTDTRARIQEYPNYLGPATSHTLASRYVIRISTLKRINYLSANRYFFVCVVVSASFFFWGKSWRAKDKSGFVYRGMLQDGNARCLPSYDSCSSKCESSSGEKMCAQLHKKTLFLVHEKYRWWQNVFVLQKNVVFVLLVNNMLFPFYHGTAVDSAFFLPNV